MLGMLGTICSIAIIKPKYPTVIILSIPIFVKGSSKMSLPFYKSSLQGLTEPGYKKNSYMLAIEGQMC